MHASAKAAIEGKLRNALSKAVIEDGLVQVWDECFSPAIEEILKTCGHWVENRDVLLIIYNHAKAALPEEIDDEVPSVLVDHVSEDDRAQLATEIADFLETLPRDYDVYFPLPNVQIENDVVISDLIAFVRTAPVPESMKKGLRRAPPGGSDLQPGTTYLRVRGKGYGNTGLDGSAMREATGLMKETVQICVLKGAFRHNPHNVEGNAIARLLGHASETLLISTIFEEGTRSEYLAKVALTSDCSRYLRGLELSDPMPQHLLGLVSGAIDDGTSFRRLIAGQLCALTADDIGEDAGPLRSALEWQFDAESEQDPVVTFIKICISLEAALAEDVKADRVTERLSDRVAFVLGDSPGVRRDIRDRMRKIYELRSTLVHGVKRKLDSEERALRYWAQAYLADVLTKEIDALQRWHEKRASV